MIAVQTIDRVISALDALTDDNPDFERTVDFYEELLPLLYAARPALDGLTLNRDWAKAKLAEGVPLLWGEFGRPAALGTEPNIELFMTLCRLATEGGSDSADALMRAFLGGILDLKLTLTHALCLDRPALTETARSLAVEPALLESVARYTLSPIAWSYRYAFSQALDFKEWGRGYCPVCGDWPILAELRGRDKLRYLRCGRCGAGWKFNRLQCLWCDNTNKKELSFLFDPTAVARRVDVCDYCRGYIKTITTFDPLDAELLAVYDLETMALDHIAAHEGYQRPFKQPLPQ
ncbi:MAG: formate dehydrogenase accessory protein FdhE [Anaerolineales bacterium]|nr:formate dehydrogenase accessory protein FdhE [Anaerolineales bacterium]